MARFLLIHGSAHGAWCWRDVVPELTALGHTVTAIDLPGNGSDATPLGEVTLDLWADAIVRAIDEPVILVGHSLGGYPITLAAEKVPERIARLVYLCAYTPWPGLSLTEMRLKAPRQPLIEAIRRSEDGIWMDFDPAMIEAKFYHDCPPGTLAYASAHLCRQAIQPNSVPVSITDRSAALPRSYILCRNDQAIPPEFQREMAARFAPEDVYEMQTGHSPFFADPARLAAILSTIAEKT
jgi:pimeloyl-ACP methyl ester carboxylesterase